ncbi:MAG: 50S ribosomal protein L10 [Phycisphaerae bacterium]|nr:50S ribosomal protein L10 [Phycisphaerae bacterium]
MSKAVKEMMMRDYLAKMGEDPNAVVITLKGVDGIKNNEMRLRFAEKDIHFTMIRNSLFLKTYEGKDVAALEPVLTGSNVLAYGAESVVEVAREIVDIVKELPDIELKGAVLDGILFEGEAGVKALSKYPTRDEAIAQDVTLILSPGRKLLGAVKGPGGRLLGIVKAIEDKLEKGEAIAPVA